MSMLEEQPQKDILKPPPILHQNTPLLTSYLKKEKELLWLQDGLLLSIVLEVLNI